MRKPSLATLRLLHRGDDPVATLLLNRPERLNALSHDMLGEIVTACRWLDETPAIKAVVVRGAGRAFSAGFDLNDFVSMDESRVVARHRRSGAGGRRGAHRCPAADRRSVPRALRRRRSRACRGLRSAVSLSDDVRFSIPEVDLGIPLAWGGIPRLVRELGPAMTKELVLTCRPFDADEALALRFLNRVVPADDLVDRSGGARGRVAAKPGFSLRATKRHVNAVMDEIAGVARNANDADTLVAALLDPESRETSRNYLRSRNR